MVPKAFLALFTLIPSIFFFVGICMAFVQQHRLASYLPVTATVLDRRVEEHVSHDSEGDSTSYKPVVRFTYEVAGRTYTCNRATPMDQSASHAWASRVIAPYTPGQRCLAYYDPGSPSSAFLVPEVGFFPYIFILFPMLFFGIAVGLAFGTKLAQGRSVPAPLLRADKWLEVRPAVGIGRRSRAWSWLTLAWSGVGLLAFGNYFHTAIRPYETISIVFVWVYGGLGLVPAILAIYLRLLACNVLDARVLIDAPLISCGGQVSVRVEQVMLAPRLIQELKLGLICDALTEKEQGVETTYSSHICHQTWATLMENHSTRPGEVLVGTHALRVPADAPPSSPSTFKGYPFYRWCVRVVTRIAGSPNYQADFAIFITAPEPAAAPSSG